MSRGDAVSGKAAALATLCILCPVLSGFARADDEPLSAQQLAERALMMDTPREVPELQQRLYANAVIQGDMLILRDPFNIGPLKFLPVIPQWTADCGPSGISITFIYGVSSADRFRLALTKTPLSEDQCVNLASPVVADAKNYLRIRPFQ
jgi:hypothetical protein